MNPLPSGESAAQGNIAGAPASEAPRPRVAAGAGGDESEANQGVPSSQQGRSSRRWIRPGCPPPSSRGNSALRAALGQQTQGRHKEEGPASRDTSSKRSQKTWRSPELGSRAAQDNQLRGGGGQPCQILREIVRRLGKSKSPLDQGEGGGGRCHLSSSRESVVRKTLRRANGAIPT